MTELSSQLDRRPLFQARIVSAAELQSSKEFAPVLDWHTETCRKLPEMRVNTNLIAKDQKIINPDPSFFSFAHLDIATPQKSWKQAGIIQRGEPMRTTSRELTETHGAAILLMDPDGRIFVTVSQEPMAQAKYKTSTGMLRDHPVPGGIEIHPVVRTPLQASAEKLKRIMSSEKEGRIADPVMTAILTKIALEQHASIKQVMEQVPFSQAETDGNRMRNNILYGAIPVSTDIASSISTLIPDGRWVTPEELDALTILGATNGTINIARSVVQAQKILSQRS